MKKYLKLLMYKTRILNFIYKLFWIFPIKNNKIFCLNFDGKQYGESPKYIVEELNKNSEYDVVWGIKDIDKTEKNIRYVKMYTFNFFYELATSKIWIFNTRKKFFISKRKKQYYVQTWHGCIALKKIEKDVEELLPKTYIMDAKKDSKDIDLFVSSNKIFSEQCKTAFDYYGEIIEEGTPKNDLLINGKFNKEELYKKLNINKDVKLILYAPTFRENYENDPYDIDLQEMINKLEEITNQKWLACVKFHPNYLYTNKYQQENKCDKIKIEEIKNLDIVELILLADIVITDYSSIMFDAMIINKNVILYVKDLKEYNKERGMYFDIENLPFIVAYNNEDLLNKMEKNIYSNQYLETYKEFKRKIGLNETGHASKSIAERIEKQIKMNESRKEENGNT